MPTCKHCGARIFKDKTVWSDLTGGDVCPVNETPVYDREDPNRLIEMKSGGHEPEVVAKK